jgi:tetratricopeptide (TPR) repeat protein
MTAGAELSRASAMIDLGRFAEAVRLLGAVVAAAPDSCRAWCLLSRAQLGHGDPAAAVVAARRASALDPADDWPFRLASTALVGLGRPADALAAARQGRRLAPHLWRPQVCLAQAAVAAGERELAAGAIAAALALAPDEPEVHVVAGKVALGDGDLRAAAACQRAALALDPDNTGAINELGLISLRSSDPVTAAGYFLRAVRAAPGTGAFGQNTEVALRTIAIWAACMAGVLVLLMALAATGADLAVLTTTRADRLTAAVMAGAAVVLMALLSVRLARTLRTLPRAARRQLPRLLWAGRTGLLAQRSRRLLGRRFRSWGVR